MYFFLLFMYPIVELWLLFKMFSAFGFLNSLFTVLFVSAFGLALIFSQSQQIMQDLTSGKHISLDYMLNSTTRAVSGILIALPGFISFTLGILLLIPFSKKLLLSAVGKIFQTKTSQSSFYQHRSYTSSNYSSSDQDLLESELNQGRIIEGELVDKDEAKQK